MSQADSSDVNSQILMEAGTNELEILVFKVDNETFGINVAKVREVIRPPQMVKPPNQHYYVIGAFDLRGVVIPSVSVRTWLGYPDQIDEEKDRVIVTEFNDVWFGFRVDAVDPSGNQREETWITALVAEQSGVLNEQARP